MTTIHIRCSSVVRRFTPAAAAIVLLSATGCGDSRTPTGPSQIPSASTPRRSLDSPDGGSAEFSVSGQAPLAGDSRDIGRFPTPTVVAMTVHQDFAIVPTRPGSSGTGRLGLAGRISGFGCTHQGEAALVNFPDGGDYGFPFAGCRFAASDSVVTSLSDTVLLDGLVQYGYSFDAACPYPDSACASYTGTSGVSLHRLSASLAIAGDSVREGTLRARPRREYTLTAAASPARLGRFQTPIRPMEGGWAFVPDSGPAQTDVCDNGSARSCVKTFTASGFLTLDAIVNGVRMTSPPLRVQMPALALSVSADSVVVGDTVLATTTVLGLDPSELSYYYVSPAPGGAGGTPRADGTPACLATRPVPTHCYVVFTQPGRMLFEVGAFLDQHGLAVFSQRYVVVRDNGSRAVKLAVSRPTIEPTARYWRFDTQTRQYTPHPTRVPDTSRTVLTVSVLDAAGAIVPNADVTLSLHARERSAGHEHTGDKPTGILETLAHAPIVDGVVNTGPSGVTRLYFVASEVSGPVRIAALSSRARPDSTSVDVRVSGLVSLDPGPRYVFTGAVAGQHTDNHYGTPAALAAFREFADTVSTWIGEPLGINDISLEQGGLFDVGGHPWDLPHGYHRRGTHADIRTKYASRQLFSKKLQERMHALWRVTLHHGIPVNEDDHLHLNFYP